MRYLGDERRAIVDRIDPIEPRLNRRDAGLIDRRFVHARSVEIAELLLRTARGGGCGRFRVLFENRVQNVAIALSKLFESAVARVLRRQGIFFAPRADCVVVEIVAGVDARIHAGNFESVRADQWLRRRCRLSVLGCLLLRCRCGACDRDQDDREGQEATHCKSSRGQKLGAE